MQPQISSINSAKKKKGMESKRKFRISSYFHEEHHCPLCYRKGSNVINCFRNRLVTWCKVPNWAHGCFSSTGGRLVDSERSFMRSGTCFWGSVITAIHTCMSSAQSPFRIVLSRTPCVTIWSLSPDPGSTHSTIWHNIIYLCSLFHSLKYKPRILPDLFTFISQHLNSAWQLITLEPFL